MRTELYMLIFLIIRAQLSERKKKIQMKDRNLNKHLDEKFCRDQKKPKRDRSGDLHESQVQEFHDFSRMTRKFLMKKKN